MRYNIVYSVCSPVEQNLLFPIGISLISSAFNAIVIVEKE